MDPAVALNELVRELQAGPEFSHRVLDLGDLVATCPAPKDAAAAEKFVR